MQKRLLLCNLKELYAAYRKEHMHKIGFSKFCELRPKWCVSAGAPGTHSVCVCTVHQNVKLMIAATDIKESYQELMAKCVCELSQKNCMLGRCEECPGENALKQYLTQCFEEVAPEENIEFKQWVHTDREMMITKQLSVEDFILDLARKIIHLTSHHFIAKHQSGYLKNLKEEIEEGEVIILMDFAENYSFVIQDESQGFHWDNSQATLHPFVVYYRDEGELKNLNFCTISDCLVHNAAVVHIFISKVVEFLKSLLPQLKHIYYFSDGAGGQYKNFKNFLNICYHKKDYQEVSAEWNFFATSHGKSPCDGIGGMVKRQAARASLQRIYTDQILTPEALFNWCCERIKSVKFFHLK